MKKALALVLTAIFVLSSALVLSAAGSGADAMNFNSPEAVAKWVMGGSNVGADFYDKNEGVDGTGALIIDGAVCGGVTQLSLPKSVNIPKGSDVTITFSCRSNTPLNTPWAGGKRVVVRLLNNDNTRTSDGHPGDDSWVTTSTLYKGDESSHTTQYTNVDKDYDTIEIVAFNLTDGDVVYIDNISFTDANGKSYSVLGGSSGTDAKKTTAAQTTAAQTTESGTTTAEITTDAGTTDAVTTTDEVTTTDAITTTDETTDTSEVTTADTSATTEKDNKDDKKGPNWTAIILIAAAIVVAADVAIVIIRKKKK